MRKRTAKQRTIYTRKRTTTSYFVAPTPSTNPQPNSLSIGALSRLCSDWISFGQAMGWSKLTIESRRLYTKNLIWFLQNRYESPDGSPPCADFRSLRAFLAYLRQEDLQGKWGVQQGGNPRFVSGVSEITAATYHSHISAFFSWCEREEAVQSSPMKRVPIKSPPKSHIVPLAEEQCQQLLKAATNSRQPERDVALVTFLIDTGLRAAEACNLRVSQIDFVERTLTVVGKGGKPRTIYFGRESARALRRYLKATGRTETGHDESRLFFAQRGTTADKALTTCGLTQLIERLGEAAGIRGVRCSPHTLRHTFAIMFLRRGGHCFALQQLLGHSTMAMTMRYVNLAASDIKKQMSTFSPMDGFEEGDKNSASICKCSGRPD